MALLKDWAEKLFPKGFDEQDEYAYGSDGDEAVEEYQEPRNTPVRAQENVYSSRHGNVSMVGGSSIEMKVVTPKSYDTVAQIADLLLSKKTVLLNLENTNRETARRLIDFLSGAAYALGGEIQKVAENTYAVTPNNVAVSKESVGAMPQAQPQQPAADEIQSEVTGF